MLHSFFKILNIFLFNKFGILIIYLINFLVIWYLIMFNVFLFYQVRED